MSFKKVRIKGNIYKNKRYWYHVSTTLKNKHELLVPWENDKGFNRSDTEPEGKRICVAPSIEQCITAIPYHLGAICSIYRTKSQVKAKKAKNVFDRKITQEGWIQKPTNFIKIGILKFEDVEKGLGIDSVIDEAASSFGEVSLSESRNVLKWWKKAKINRFIKKA